LFLLPFKSVLIVNTVAKAVAADRFYGKDKVIGTTLQAFGFSCAILHRMWPRVPFLGF
jgi:hypothetical protein